MCGPVDFLQTARNRHPIVEVWDSFCEFHASSILPQSLQCYLRCCYVICNVLFYWTVLYRDSTVITVHMIHLGNWCGNRIPGVYFRLIMAPVMHNTNQCAMTAVNVARQIPTGCIWNYNKRVSQNNFAAWISVSAIAMHDVRLWKQFLYSDRPVF